MKGNVREYFPGVMNVVTGIGVILISFAVELRFPMAKETAKALGIFIIATGMSLVVWSAFHLKEAFRGEVQPKLNYLIQEGPYRFVRHPVYLGITTALIGVAVSLRSWLGVIGVFVLFLPSVVYRAKLEERALHHKFGDEWREYASRVGFMLPFLGKRGP